MTETTTTTDTIPLSINGLTWRKITDQIVAGVEGGISYWASSFKPEGEISTDVSPWYDDEKFWAAGGWKILIKVHDERKPKEMTPESMRNGLQYLADNHLWRIEQMIKENGDAETGDVFIQSCLFGDIVYG
ncbi:hypothetical protein [Bradyrhizobium ottawaense]|uniref:Uncharacterized protein n=1 Tax=Bradyrhizobium ottawaense TaxID=931866 RepID=A0ABY0QHE8_9BRAD|nr:hypothetical protein [Bradyrhizobium ottawaense]SDK45024.1 hypothetical protein SAMN05444163_8139 [Bradyrhizobium ottawaense]